MKYISWQLNQKQREIHNLQMRLKKCVKELDALKEKKSINIC